MLGMNHEQAMASQQQSCEGVFKHAHLRRTFKGVAEIVKIKKETALDEEEKMQIEWTRFQLTLSN